MREILFRGKRIDNGEWVYGSYVAYTEPVSLVQKHAITNGCVAYDDRYGKMDWRHCVVDPATIGQFTGLTDKNGKRIFEGDIVGCWSEGVYAQGAVQQRKDGLWIIYPAWQKHIMWGLRPDDCFRTGVEAIGNIHDNPEMVEGANDENT